MNLSYLEKFNNLPPQIRQVLEAPAVLSAMVEIGRRYQTDLAVLVIRVAVGEIDYQHLDQWFLENWHFDKVRAQGLANELKQKVFFGITDYLGQVAKVLTAPVPNVDDYIKKKLATVLASAKLILGSQTMETRLNSIILTYLKGVRDKFTTREALIKPQASGGLGLDEESAENLLLLADGQLQNGQQAVVRPPLLNQGYGGQGPKIAVPEDRLKDEAGYSLEKKSPPALQPKLQPPVLSKVTGLVPSAIIVPVLKPTPKPLPPKPQLPISKIQPLISNIPKSDSGRPRMDDIKTAPKVFSPVDELRFMTLRNWRNLDADPAAVLVKIKQKLKALENEDYPKLIAGIKAFKQSPLNRMYLSILSQGLEQGKTVEAVLAEKRAGDPAGLTVDEFEAIIKLNQELKF